MVIPLTSGRPMLTTDFDEAELAKLEDPNRTPAFGWFVGFSSHLRVARSS